jgi:hypothetical protein
MFVVYSWRNWAARHELAKIVNTNMKTHMARNARLWNGVVFSILVALMMHLTVGTDAMRADEPWPMLLPDNSADSDPAVTLLQQRANGSLERLVQAARTAEEL